ncbi:site-specific integrase [Paraburkholderia guartelaensis]|uniref:site-specific integrase n=1 Tax=Paraburkholderia guartelaensis TaxID=2546446 RepID=UPI002AB5E6AA|nr:site-specific integrase [Paraburkholderia guartelaensis]
MPPHKGIQIPDLSLNVDLGPIVTPWSLNIFLYRGGAAANARDVQTMIEDGKLGEPLIERLELATSLRDELNSQIESGTRLPTVTARLTCLRHFLSFADRSGYPLTLSAVAETYCAWGDSLFHRTRLQKHSSKKRIKREDAPLKQSSAYQYAVTVGQFLDTILDRNTCIIEMTRLERSSPRNTAAGVQAEKQNLEHTFAFGHFVREICEGLTLYVVRDAPLPFTLCLPNERTLILGRRTSGASVPDDALKTRHALVNLRIEAELFMFIGQTGMNLAQAYKLELEDYQYVSHLEGYQVRKHKARRGGGVIFEIFTAYREHFEKYLEWRKALFPKSSLLFPFLEYEHTGPLKRFQGARLRALCREFDILFVGPRMLRNTRVNWLLRRTGDAERTSEMVQSTVKTVQGVYFMPSLQRAMVEGARFWTKHDPHLKVDSVAPGACNGTPKEMPNVPKSAPRPDCKNGAGCLWCANHRDIDSFDYVWSLASFRRVKVIELGRARSPHTDNGSPPAVVVIDRILEKTRWFEQSNKTRREWVNEAEARFNEGDFHPDWADIIRELEGIE